MPRLELAKLGAKVVVNDLGGAMDGTGGSSEAAANVVDEIKAAGGEAIANGGSVSDARGAKSMVEDAMKAWGRVDILINNAGILRDKSFTKMTMEDFRAVLEVHLMGSVHCTKEVWPIMREQGYGRIVMTTSPSGLVRQFRSDELWRGKAVAGRIHEHAEDRRRKEQRVHERDRAGCRDADDGKLDARRSVEAPRTGARDARSAVPVQ